MFKNIFSSSKNLFDYKSETLNIVESLSKAKPLYKELIQIAHPDKNPDKIELATEISNLLNEHRFNYAVLSELKKRIEKELKTDFFIL